jgi:quercetin dioxygenase-like cupin family protein
MKVTRNDRSAEQLATTPIFVGTVHSRPLVGADDSDVTTVNLVRFTDGGKNKRHTHSNDQVLYIVEGDGIVADDAEEHLVSAGDCVHVPSGTVHWHGAQPGKDMAHLSILPPGTKTEVLD